MAIRCCASTATTCSATWSRFPNLGTRANRYLGYLVQTYAFGRREAESPLAAASERPWFILYAVLSFAYRITIMVAIAVFIGSSFFFVGVLLAGWAVFGMLVWPLIKSLKFVIAGQELREHRRRALLVTSAAAALLLGGVFALPLPNATLAQGVVWAPAGSAVRAQTPGVVVELLQSPGAAVAKGDALLRLADPELQALAKITEARLQELNGRYNALFVSNRVEANVLKEEIARAREQLERFHDRIADLMVRAPEDGRFVLPAADDLVGRFIGRGQELGYTLDAESLRLRAVVPEARVALVRDSDPAVGVRLASAMEQVLPGRVIREVPAAGDVLPSPALAGSAGGPFPVEPMADGTARALTPIFQFEIAVEGGARGSGLGERAHIRFEHAKAPLAALLYRELRQLFLSQFDV